MWIRLFGFGVIVAIVALLVGKQFRILDYNIASRTSMAVTVCRAMGNDYPAVPGFSDPFAKHFLPTSVFYGFLKWEDIKRNLLPFLPPYSILFRRLSPLIQYRTVVLDAALKNQLPFDQLVILGAGLDSRAWRMKELAAIKVFEVDHPATQSWKRQQVKKIEGEQKAKEVKFVSVDFRTDDLKQKLEEAGFEKEKKTFWIWEGVTMYLEEEDVKKTMRLVSELSVGGGSLALTYLKTDNGKVPFAWWVAMLGEPFRSVYSAIKIELIAQENGAWNTLENTGIEDWQKKYTPGYQVPDMFIARGLYERVWVGSAHL